MVLACWRHDFPMEISTPHILTNGTPTSGADGWLCTEGSSSSWSQASGERRRGVELARFFQWWRNFCDGYVSRFFEEDAFQNYLWLLDIGLFAAFGIWHPLHSPMWYWLMLHPKWWISDWIIREMVCWHAFPSNQIPMITGGCSIEEADFDLCYPQFELANYELYQILIMCPYIITNIF